MWTATVTDRTATPHLEYLIDSTGLLLVRDLTNGTVITPTAEQQTVIVAIWDTLLHTTLPTHVPAFSPKFQPGLLADRPQPGGEERFYLATDGPALYLDDGAAWQLLLGGDAAPEVASMRSLGPDSLQAAPPLHQHGEPSLLFLAAGSKVSIADYGGMHDIWSGGGTVEVQLNPFNAGQAGNGNVLRKTNPGWFLQIFGLSQGTVYLHFLKHFTDDYGAWSSVERVLPVNEFSRVAVTYNSDSPENQPTFYVNGVPVPVAQVHTPVGISLSDAGNDLIIGNSPSGSRTLEGLIGDVRIWQTTRTPQQIADHQKAVLTGSEPGLAGYWRIWEGQGSTAFNSVPNGKHGALTDVQWRTTL